jgi:hypothetical protein
LRAPSTAHSGRAGWDPCRGTSFDSQDLSGQGRIAPNGASPNATHARVAAADKAAEAIADKRNERTEPLPDKIMPDENNKVHLSAGRSNDDWGCTNNSGFGRKSPGKALAADRYARLAEDPRNSMVHSGPFVWPSFFAIPALKSAMCCQKAEPPDRFTFKSNRDAQKLKEARKKRLEACGERAWKGAAPA